MVKDELIKKFVTIYTQIERKCLHPQFSFPGGGKVYREMEAFVDRLEKEFGEISNGRIVDYCICLVHYRRDLNRIWKPNLSFGPKSIERYIEFKGGKRYFEDQWLKENGLTRSELEAIISDNTTHPLAQYIYLESEEQTKKRAQKLKMGVLMCERSTLLYTPFSKSCTHCNSIIECKALTQKLYPELFRIRLERWQKTK